MLAHLTAVPGQRGALYAGCGSGKTVTVLTHVLDRQSGLGGRHVPRWLVVAPPAVAQDTWQRDAASWRHTEALAPHLIDFGVLGLRREIVAGRPAGLVMEDRKEVRKRLLSLPGDLHVCSYGALGWIVEAFGKRWPYGGVVFDESTFLKEPTSERFRGARRAVWATGQVEEVIELAGLPNPQSYEDLYGQFWLLDKGARLGTSKTDFRGRWMHPVQWGKNGTVYAWGVRPEMLEPLQRKVAELAISVDHETGIELVESLQHVALPEKARRLYEDLKRDLLAVYDDRTIAPAHAGAMWNKLLQICNGHVFTEEAGVRSTHHVHDAKIDALAEAIEANPTPVLLAYNYQPERAVLKKRLGKAVQFSDERGAIDSFRRGQLKVLATHPESMAHGVDGLQLASNTVFWYGATSRYDWYHQVYKRLQRSGSEFKTVYVRTFVADKTLEPGVHTRRMRGKEDGVQGLLAALRAE